jgi:hypothetical protein
MTTTAAGGRKKTCHPAASIHLFEMKNLLQTGAQNSKKRQDFSPSSFCPSGSNPPNPIHLSESGAYSYIVSGSSVLARDKAKQKYWEEVVVPAP